MPDVSSISIHRVETARIKRGRTASGSTRWTEILLTGPSGATYTLTMFAPSQGDVQIIDETEVAR